MFEAIFSKSFDNFFQKFVECSQNILVVKALKLTSTVCKSKRIVVFYKFIKNYPAYSVGYNYSIVPEYNFFLTCLNGLSSVVELVK